MPTLAALALLVASATAAPLAHSHNDYTRPRPLEAALEAGLQSVEVDLWRRRGRLVAAHTRLDPGLDLEAVYLAPLQARVDASGSVYGDGEPLHLWLDLKEDEAALLEDLQAALARYPMVGGAVRVILTGDHGAKTAYAARYPTPPVERDSNSYDPGDPPADESWTCYALSWRRYVGRGAPTPEGLAALGAVVEGAHAVGRRVRVYGAPDTPEVWGALIDAGVDYVGTDDVPGLAAFLAAPQPPPI